jgi:hypothetical protein
MKIHWILLGIAYLAPTEIFSSIYYVDTKGNDSNLGTLDSPYASLRKANERVVPGDTVYIRGGTYNIKGVGASSTSGITISKSGQSDAKRICFWAYQHEHPIFDFSELTLSATTAGSGFTVTGSWLHFKGFEVCNVPEPGTPSNNGITSIGGSNNIFEFLDSHHNKGTGIFINGGEGGNLLLNCDAHHNYDPFSNKGAGQNADGFGVHYQKTGTPTVLRGCRAWWNSDDGFDCINQDQPVIIENCWNWLHGYVPGTMTSATAGNGNGFKIGGYGMPPSKYPSKIPQHSVRNCIAFLNKAAGFYQNHQLGPSLFLNNTSFNNRSANFNMLGYDLVAAGDKGMGTYKNNVAFTGTSVSNPSGADATFNSWNLSGLTVAATDFESLDTTGVSGPRKPDGSLPDIRFLHLSASSHLIDKGTKLDLPFSGDAPDLGAFEFGMTTGVKKVKTEMEAGSDKAKVVGDGKKFYPFFDLAGKVILPSGAFPRNPYYSHP